MWFPGDLQSFIEEAAPESFTLPNGKELPVDYTRSPPTVRASFQDVFGLQQLPPLAGGCVEMCLELLLPDLKKHSVRPGLSGGGACGVRLRRRQRPATGQCTGEAV